MDSLRLSLGPSALLSPGITIFQVIFFTLGIGLLIGAIFSERRGGPAARRRGEPDDFDRPPWPGRVLCRRRPSPTSPKLSAKRGNHENAPPVLRPSDRECGVR